MPEIIYFTSTRTEPENQGLEQNQGQPRDGRFVKKRLSFCGSGEEIELRLCTKILPREEEDRVENVWRIIF